jgi:hypothetical protein
VGSNCLFECRHSTCLLYKHSTWIRQEMLSPRTWEKIHREKSNGSIEQNYGDPPAKDPEHWVTNIAAKSQACERLDFEVDGLTTEAPGGFGRNDRTSTQINRRYQIRIGLQLDIYCLVRPLRTHV